MSARISLDRTRCDDESVPADWYAARRVLLQHGNHSYGCVQFVTATAYIEVKR